MSYRGRDPVQHHGNRDRWPHERHDLLCGSSIRQTPTKIELADSLADALAGTALDLTSAGTGVQTLLPRKVQLAASPGGNALNLDPSTADAGSTHRFVSPDPLAQQQIEYIPVGLDSNNDFKITTADAHITAVTPTTYVTDYNTLVLAEDDSKAFNIVGGVISSKNIGFGVSVAVDDITRNTQAWIGNDQNLGVGTLGTTINAGGNVQLVAKNAGIIATLALAAAIARIKLRLRPSPRGCEGSARMSANDGRGWPRRLRIQPAWVWRG